MAYFRGQILKHNVTGESWVVVNDDDLFQLQRNIVLSEKDVDKDFTVVNIIAGPTYPEAK